MPISCNGSAAALFADMMIGMKFTHVPRSGMNAVLAFAIIAAAVFAASPVAIAQQATATQPAKSNGGDKLPIAAIVSEYRVNSHADMIVGRVIQTASLDDQGRTYPLEIVSLYTDQVPENDTSRALAAKYNFKISESVRDALTLGSDKLEVKGVLLVAEHGKYERNEYGNIMYPKRPLFEEVVKVFRETGEVVPVFIDKHISDNWDDIKWMMQQADELDIPMMAGSSLPMAWREPQVDVKKDAKLDQIVVLSYHTLDAYGFHAIEMAQTLAERRAGGETGIRSVRTLANDQVWEAFENPSWDPKLFDLAMERLPRDRLKGRDMKDVVRRDPSIMVINYEDGLTTYIFTLNGIVGNWTAAWRYADGKRDSTFVALQDGRPYFHFAILTDEITKMFLTGEPTYPVQRTVLSSGALDSLLISLHKNGETVETPQLDIDYKTDWQWQQPEVAPPIQPRKK